MQLIISDASVLIDIEFGQLLEPMFSIGYQYAVPDILYYEELEERHSNLLALGLKKIPMDGSLIKQVETIAQNSSKTSRNDLFSLVLAKHQECPLLTSDKELRKLAEKYTIDVHGTIWLVNEMLHKHKVISFEKARLAYTCMKANGSRLPWDEVEKSFNNYHEKSVIC